MGYICTGIKVIRSDSNSSGWVSHKVNRFLFFYMAECRGSIDGCHRRKKKSHPAEIAFWCRSHHKNPSLWSLASQLVLKTLFDSFLSWFFKFRQNSQQFWQSIYHLSQSPRKKSQIYAVPGPSGFTAFFLFFHTIKMEHIWAARLTIRQII